MAEYNVGDECPNCHRSKLRRGIKYDKGQLFCPSCGFTGDRKVRFKR